LAAVEDRQRAVARGARTGCGCAGLRRVEVRSRVHVGSRAGAKAMARERAVFRDDPDSTRTWGDRSPRTVADDDLHEIFTV